ncbi:hypothetical protein [Sphingomonas lenta]|uniref:Cobalt transporter n=1 Tax=Sphingomonas lenta TaxID=1141887 RepID=A0A2A2SJQ0_9SPHN|nr:hypothetical protein [Sphingomonas lenta]PAX09448.1 hypothetical protein CKY28_01455 [Sphingomonas lenta]
MLARLLLALLAIVFATPVAAAACHVQPAREQHADMAHHGSAPADSDEAAPADACVGCVPPSTWIAPRVAEPVAFAAPMLAATVALLSLGRGTPPALPPPRIG